LAAPHDRAYTIQSLSLAELLDHLDCLGLADVGGVVAGREHELSLSGGTLATTSDRSVDLAARRA
jgi:hypothetical protein